LPQRILIFNCVIVQEYGKDRERIAEVHVNKGLDLAETDTSAALLLFSHTRAGTSTSCGLVQSL